MSEVTRGPSLGAAIAQARRELEQARLEGVGSEVHFRVEEMELEFLVEVSGSAAADAGVRFWVVSLGAKGEVRHGDTNRVRVKLKPITPEGAVLAVGSEEARRPDATITGGGLMEGDG